MNRGWLVQLCLGSMMLGGCVGSGDDSIDFTPPPTPPIDQAPIAHDADVTIRNDGPVQITLKATDADTATLTYSVLQPALGTVTVGAPTSPVVTYTPGNLAWVAGEDSIFFTVFDGTFYADATVTIHLRHENAPVAISSVFTISENQSVSFTLMASDPDGDPLTFQPGTTAGGTISGTPPNLVYTPNLGFFGTDFLNFSVNDGILTAYGIVQFNVQRLNLPPTATPQNVAINEDIATTITLAGTDPDGDLLRFSAGLAAHGSVSESGAQGEIVTYIPNPNYNGPDSFTFTASDGFGGTSQATVTINIAPVNDPPFANNLNPPAFNEDTSTTITLSGGDVDGDPISFVIRTKPQHGTLSDPVGNSPKVTYTPDKDFNGTDSFTYQAFDGNLLSPFGTVQLTITSVDDAPVTTDITVPATEDKQVSFQLPVTDVDTPVGLLKFIVQTQPTDGTLVVTTAGKATYTPAANANGTRTFTFFVNDGQLNSNVSTATIQIAAVEDPPIAVDDWVATDVATPLTIDVLANDSDPDGDALTITDKTDPASGTLDLVDGKLVYVPDVDFSGVDTFTYTIVDPSGEPATATVHVGVGSFPVGAPNELIAKTAVFTSAETDREVAISADGRYIAFDTIHGLVADDTNGVSDVYVYDRGTRTLERVDLASDGTKPDGACRRPQISADGRYVVFECIANNLVPGDTNSAFDIFRHDRVTGETIRVSVATGGGQASGNSRFAQISDDGSIVAFVSDAFDLVPGDANGASDVFVRDINAGTTTRVSISLTGADADLASTDAALSGDGQFVAFTSAATNLVASDGNTKADIFVRDLAAGTTTRASVATTGGESNGVSSQPSISSDGRFISLQSNATNLVGSNNGLSQLVYVRDAQSPTTTEPSVLVNPDRAMLSGDGRYVVVASASNGAQLCDRFAAKTVSPPGMTTWRFPVIASGGRYIAAVDTSGNLFVGPNPL